MRKSKLNREVERIIRVDHAGEHGAIRIYTAQLTIANILYKDIAPLLREMLQHELSHHETFSALLHKRKVRTCYALPIWAVGGYTLGLITAMFGRNAIWVCTASIESTVLHHLEWQLEYLKAVDVEAHNAVASIKSDEEEHLQHGNQRGKTGFIYLPIFVVVRYSTKFAIWLSTKL